MNKIKIYIKLLLITIYLWPMHGALCAMPTDSCAVAAVDTCKVDSMLPERIMLPFTEYPFEIADNTILNDSANMAVWRKLIASATGERKEPFRVMHIGESHVNGGTFAETVSHLLKDSIAGID